MFPSRMARFELIVTPEPRRKAWMGGCHGDDDVSRGPQILAATFHPAPEGGFGEVEALHAVKQGEGLLAKDFIILRRRVFDSFTPANSLSSRSNSSEGSLSSLDSSSASSLRPWYTVGRPARRQGSGTVMDDLEVAAVLRASTGGSHYLLASCAAKEPSADQALESGPVGSTSGNLGGRGIKSRGSWAEMLGRKAGQEAKAGSGRKRKAGYCELEQAGQPAQPSSASICPENLETNAATQTASQKLTSGAQSVWRQMAAFSCYTCGFPQAQDDVGPVLVSELAATSAVAAASCTELAGAELCKDGGADVLSPSATPPRVQAGQAGPHVQASAKASSPCSSPRTKAVQTLIGTPELAIKFSRRLSGISRGGLGPHNLGGSMNPSASRAGHYVQLSDDDHSWMVEGISTRYAQEAPVESSPDGCYSAEGAKVPLMGQSKGAKFVGVKGAPSNCQAGEASLVVHGPDAATPVLEMYMSGTESNTRCKTFVVWADLDHISPLQTFSLCLARADSAVPGRML